MLRQLPLAMTLLAPLAVRALYFAAQPIAGIEAQYGSMYIGNRIFFMATYALSPRFTASAFITRAVGNEVALPQRTLSNLIFAYNALPNLRRTGLF